MFQRLSDLFTCFAMFNFSWTILLNIVQNQNLVQPTPISDPSQGTIYKFCRIRTLQIYVEGPNGPHEGTENAKKCMSRTIPFPSYRVRIFITKTMDYSMFTASLVSPWRSCSIGVNAAFSIEVMIATSLWTIALSCIFLFRFRAMWALPYGKLYWVANHR